MVKNVIEFVFAIGLFVNALLFIPQAIKIFKEKTAEGVSLTTFIGFFIIQFAIVLHGVIAKDIVLTIGYVLSMMTTGLVIVFTLYYKKRNFNNELLTLEDIIAQLPGHVYWKNKDFVSIGSNTNNWRDFGCNSLSDFRGKTDYDLFNKEEADILRKTDEEIIRTGLPKIVEERAKCADGTSITYLTHKVPLRNKKGEIEGILGVSIDVTVSKQETLDKLEMLENIIAVMPCNVYWMNREGFYLGCNDNEAKFIGLSSRKDIVGKRNIDLTGFLIPEVLDPINEQIMSTGNPVTLEEPATLLDGTNATFISSKTPLLNSKNKIIGLLGVSVDITDRKKQEHELKISKEAAETANKIKTEFIQNMQHDIRTPAAGIFSVLNILCKKETKLQQKEILTMMAKSSKQLLDLCNDVVDFGHLEQGKEHPVVEKILDIREMADEVLDLNKPAAFSKRLALNIKIGSLVPPHIKSDDFRLNRILVNLLGNAVKFTDSGSVTLSISIKTGDKRNAILHIEVKDTGIGIEKKNLETIFERFTRLIPSNTGKYPGTGLGLYIVKKYVEELNGDLEVNSTLGTGSVFSVNIPVIVPLMDAGEWGMEIDEEYHSPLDYDEEEMALSPFNGDGESHKTKPFSHNILLIEDDNICLFAEYEMFLQLTNHVDTAISVKEAKEKLKEKRYDLVISDIGLGDGTGIDVICAAQTQPWSKNKETPFVAVTAHRDINRHQEIYSAGFKEITTKPLIPDQARKFLESNGMPLDNTEKPILDLQLIMQSLGTRSEQKAVKALDLFMSSLAEDLLILKTAEETHDVKSIREIVHKIMGALNYSGTPALQKTVQSLHAALNSDTQSAVSTWIKTVYEQAGLLETAYHELLDKRR